MNQKENVPLVLDDTLVEEIPLAVYNVALINSISDLYPGYRQESKAP